MSYPFIGQIALFPFTFAPIGWARCDGQLLPIQQNTTLFALLGTFYGGNGTTNFGLPNLNGDQRAFMGQGQGPGLSQRVLGEEIGVGTVSLTTSEMPSHTHAMTQYSGAANKFQTPNTGFALVDPLTNSFAPPGTNPVTNLSPSTLSVAGGGQAHNNYQPVLVLSYCIALQGIFPPRS